MATDSTFNVIYLGNFASIDPNEGAVRNGSYVSNVDAENAISLQNTRYDDLTAASVQQLSPISFESPDNNNRGGGYNQDNNLAGSDTFTITTQDGSTSSHAFDACAIYSGTLTYNDGTTANVPLIIFQDTSGNTWLAPPIAEGSAADALTVKPIQTIQIGALLGNRYTGLSGNRQVLDIRTVPCFTAGTLIDTESGPMAVEEITIGTLVQTADHGLQPVRWIGRRKLSPVHLLCAPQLRPVRISAGALGGGMPEHDLTVSPQHRILVRSRIAQRLFDSDEVLVAAKQLLAIEGIEIVSDPTDLTYVHLMFDRHEVVFSNGAASESLYAGPEALNAIDSDATEELLTLFPELRHGVRPVPARPLASGRLGRKLAMRHQRNSKPLMR